MSLSRPTSFLALLVLLPFAGCSSIKSLQIVPGAGVETLRGLGQTAQFKALATRQMGSATPTTSDMTRSVTWAASNPLVATIDSSGLATAVGQGTTSITAESGGVVASSDLTVTGSSAQPTAPTIAVIPGSGSAVATVPGETTQFIAIGNLSGSGATQDLTNRVKWLSSDVSVATIDQDGLATGVGATSDNNVTTITAMAVTATGSVITATSTLTMATGGQVNLPILSLYKVGDGAGSVTSTPVGVNCGPQATCTGYFPLHYPVTLTEHPDEGSVFGRMVGELSSGNGRTNGMCVNHGEQ